MNSDYVPALVIGSGFGGSVAAMRLGEAGVSTIVLERGRWWPITPQFDTFCSYRDPDGRAAWLSDETVLFAPTKIDRYLGLLERQIHQGITTITPAAVGGGSLVYNCVLYQPTRALFERVHPWMNYEEMTGYYQRAAEILRPGPIPDDILQTDYYLGMRVFMERAKRAGLSARRLPIAVDWDIVRGEIAGKYPASAIAGEVWYGINSGAKNSLDRNYLARAQKTGCVDIRSQHQVTAIAEAGDGGYKVSYEELNDVGETLRRGELRCDFLFMGAGSVHTTRLMTEAKGRGGLPRLNDEVGRQWGNNGDTFATSVAFTRTSPGTGGPAGVVLEHHDNAIAPQSLIVFPEWDAPDNTLTMLGMSVPTDLGDFRYDPATGTARLSFPMDSAANQKMVEGAQLTYRMLDEANALQFHSHFGSSQQKTAVVPQTQVNAGMTAHPIGGMALRGACDDFGRVKGYEGLYVVDAAQIPGGCAGAANPAFSVAAFAERTLEAVVAGDVLGGDVLSRRRGRVTVSNSAKFARSGAAAPKIAVMVEAHFDETEFKRFNTVFPAHGYEVEYISYLWGNPSLSFKGNDFSSDVTVTRCVTQVQPTDYRGLILIGGYAMDRLRYQEHPKDEEPNRAPAVEFLRKAVKAMDAGQLKIGTICHSLWLFCAAPELLKGRKVTCAHNILSDVTQAGGRVVFEGDQTKDIVTDGGLTSGRHPGVADVFIDVFLREMEQEGRRLLIERAPP